MKKLFKQTIAVFMVCALLIGIISTNTAFASTGGGNNKIITTSSEKADNNISQNISSEENSTELNRILEECKEVNTDNSSIKLKRGEIASVSEFVSNVSTDYHNTIAVMKNGDLYCWGYNSYGQVGNGTTQIQTIPVKVLSDVSSVSIYGSSGSVAAITKSGDLYCWGYNFYGQIGNGTTQNQTTPVKVLSDVSSVSVYSSSGSVAAITKSGDLYCWGRNSYGQIGNGTTQNQTTPVKVLGDVNSVSVYGGSGSVAAIKKNGDLYCWGYTLYGQVGNGTTQIQTTPIKVLSDVSSVSVYDHNSCSIAAITKSGDLYCWGYNNCGQVGNGTTQNQTTPVKVLNDVNSVSVYDYTSCFVAAITKNGDLYCWGANSYGQVGNGTIQNQTIPVKVLNGVSSVSVYGGSGSGSIAAITKSGDLYCWGANSCGQVGNGTTQNQTTPVKVLSNVNSVSGYCSNSVAAITKNGDLYCWGYNFYGQVGNGTTQNQLTPFKVLSNVSSVSVYDYGSGFVTAMTKNGDLYCWGANSYGQVGNGTTQNQLTPFKVSFGALSDDISRFILSETANASLKDNGNSFTFSGHIYLEDGKTANSEEWQSIVNNISWTSSNPSVVTDIKCQPVLDSKEHNDILILVSVSLKSAGKATVTGVTRYGLSSSCDVTVEEEKKKEIRHITGTLNEVNLNNFTVIIDGIKYEVTDSFDISSAYGILLSGSSKTIVAILVDGKVNQMDSVEDIVEPKINISFEPHSITYQGDVFDNTQVKIKTVLSCGAKSPYRDSDIKGTEAENVSVNLSEYSLQAPEGLEFKGILSVNKTFTKKISDVIKMGMEKNYEQIAYVTKNYVPEKVKDLLSVNATLKGNEHESSSTASLAVSNIDKQKEIAESKNISKEISEAEKLMDKITFSMGGDNYYNSKQLKSIESVVKAWIVEMLVTQILTTDTKDNSIWAEFCKEAGFSDADKKKFLTNIAKKAFKKLGLDISPIIDSDIGIHLENEKTNTIIKVYYEDGRTYDTVTVNLNFGNLSFSNSQPFTGLGTLDYTIETPDKKKPKPAGVGVVTFADLQNFSECVQNICMSQIKSIFNMDIGSNLDKGAAWIRKYINNTTENKIVEALTSDIASKLLSKNFGKVSDNVFEIYTKEIMKKTNGSVHCPVDIYIYDSHGTLCGSIVNNQVETDNGDIFLYCVGDEKYFTLIGDDYRIQFVGNDEGTMTYKIDEYCNLKLIRSISYENVKLQNKKVYKGMIPQTQLLDSTVYNLISMDDAEMIQPSSDIYTNVPEPPTLSNVHIFSDYNYNNPIADNEAIIYGNGVNKKIDGKRVNNKVFTAYTDITASYKHTPNNNGTVKSTVGKVIVAVTKTNVKPEVNSRNKVTDTSASKIAKAKIKNGQITVTAVGKEGGLVYLWVIDTGNKGVSACCPIDVKLASKKLEIQDTAGSKLKNTNLANGNTLEVCVAGFVGSTKTDDCTYTATVDSKYQSYITVTPVDGSTNKFTIKATGLKNNKDTKAVVTFKCDQNGKKTNFSLTVTN